MADPKYANLPGIDTDAPDVYETSDLPEDDQTQEVQDDDNSESVEKLNVSASDAHNRFKDKGVVSNNIDFSDRISQNLRTGYDIPNQTEYEMTGEGVKETPQQKYQRLQHEIRELAEEVGHIKEGVKADASSEKLSPVQLTKQVEYLEKQLTDLHLDKLLGANGELNLADPQGALQKRLMTELQSFKPSGTKSTVSKDVAATGDSQITYQLYYRPEQAKFSHNARMADLDQRLERLEAVVGQHPEKLSALTADTNNKSLVGAIGILSAKTKLLEPSQLEQIEGRVHALGSRLNQLCDKKESIEQADKNSKVCELYDLVKKWDAMADTIPHVVDRMVVLKDLHEQALQFSQALAHLDTAQQEINTHIKSHGDMLKQVQTTLNENVSSIKQNCENLDSRIEVLKK